MSLNYKSIDFNTGLFYKELEKRGIKLRLIKNTTVVHATYKNHAELLCDINQSTTTFTAGWIAGDKYYTKKMLEKAGIPTPQGKVFNRYSKNKALKYAKKLGFPIVLKPVLGTHGDYVYSGIDDENELSMKIDIITQEYLGEEYFLIEKHCFGQEYRLFYTIKDFFAAVHRIPANIVGDGNNSIHTLIQQENYRRMHPRINCLCEIKFDDILFDHLEKSGKSIDYTPQKGEIVQLRLSSNVVMGGNCHDVTSIVHPTVKKLAKKVLFSIPGLTFIGIDLICEDINKALEKQDYIICELNPSPGLSLHYLPEKGESKNTPAALTDLLFPVMKKL